MKIGIVGNGFVGRATQIFAKNYFARDDEHDTNTERYEILPDTASTPAKPKSERLTMTTQSGEKITLPFFKRFFFKPITVYIYDIRPEACQPPGITLEELDKECDLLFFCLPTPLHHDGSCYTKILEDTISRCNNPFKIIRSTIPVGFAAKHGCYFMPEFLTEANWENDFRSTKEWVVGIPMNSRATIMSSMTSESANTSVMVVSELRHDEFKKRITKLIKRSYKNSAIDSSTITFCDTNEAEMLKLMKNCFLSAKVSLMNEFYDFCDATHTDYKTVTDLAKKDQRMGTSHFQVPGPDGRRGFGGTCFPKDTHSLYCQMKAHDVHPHVYPAILARNDTHDRPEREWSRDVWRTTIPLPSPESKVVVVFTDVSVTPSSNSMYLTDIIRTNLAKNNVVIEVARGLLESKIVHSFTDTVNRANHLVKYHNDSSAPLFFPRVDECYYIPHYSHTTYETMREVSCVIDLWNNHKEMTLHVIKRSTLNTLEIVSSRCNEEYEESGTEGFDSDNEPNTRAASTTLDYCKIIEEYYHSKISNQPKQGRKLVVLF